MKHDLDFKVEQFLSESFIEDNGFSAQVMEQLPQTPRWVWIEDTLPAMVLAVFCIGFWKLPTLSLRALWNGAVQPILNSVAEGIGVVGPVQFNLSLGTIIAFSLILAVIAYEKIQSEVF